MNTTMPQDSLFNKQYQKHLRNSRDTILIY